MRSKLWLIGLLLLLACSDTQQGNRPLVTAGTGAPSAGAGAAGAAGAAGDDDSDPTVDPASASGGSGGAGGAAGGTAGASGAGAGGTGGAAGADDPSDPGDDPADDDDTTPPDDDDGDVVPTDPDDDDDMTPPDDPDDDDMTPPDDPDDDMTPPDDDTPAYCTGTGPAIVVPDPSVPDGTSCTPSLGRRLFSHALCSCDDTVFAGYLKTRSFDSSTASPVVAAGAPVGVNDQLISGSYVDVGGTLQVTGDTTFAGFLQVGGDLGVKQPLNVAGYLQVARDAWVENEALVLGYADIRRDLLTQPAKAFISTFTTIGGNWTTGSFGIDEPCACDPAELLDIDAIIADGQAHNDNATIGLHTRAFADVIGVARWELPCGRYYVDEVTGIGDLHLTINGRTALYVGDDVGITGHFDVEIGPDGQLDLFIKDNLVQIGYNQFDANPSPFGDPGHPSRMRIYVGGEGDILFLGYQPIAANIYAPRSRLVSAGYIDMFGSLFVKDLDAGAYIDITYDRDVINPGEACEDPPGEDPPGEDPPGEDPPPECYASCNESCGASACIAGECAPCRTDADCCAPLQCYANGQCGQGLN